MSQQVNEPLTRQPINNVFKVPKKLIDYTNNKNLTQVPLPIEINGTFKYKFNEDEFFEAEDVLPQTQQPEQQNEEPNIIVTWSVLDNIFFAILNMYTYLWMGMHNVDDNF